MIPTAAGETPAVPGADRTETADTGEIEDRLNLRYYPLTRLGWNFVFEYQPEDSPFVSGIHACVDLYTGEILSWDLYK